MILHKHHIIPRHAGGTDDPENIIELTIEEHAEAHRVLFENHGRWQDFLAWQGLAGLIGKDEFLKAKYALYRGANHHMYGKKRPEHAELMRETMKGEGNHQYGKTPWNKGLDVSDPRVAAYVNAERPVMAGEKNGMYGVKRPEMSERLQGNTHTIGYKWWNNGVEQKYATEAPAEDWVNGRLFAKRKTRKSEC